MFVCAFLAALMLAGPALALELFSSNTPGLNAFYIDGKYYCPATVYIPYSLGPFDIVHLSARVELTGTQSYPIGVGSFFAKGWFSGTTSAAIMQPPDMPMGEDWAQGVGQGGESHKIIEHSLDVTGLNGPQQVSLAVYAYGQTPTDYLTVTAVTIQARVN